MDLRKEELFARVTGKFSSKLGCPSIFRPREIQALVTLRDLAAERCKDGWDHAARELRRLEHKTHALASLLFEEANGRLRLQEVGPAVRCHSIYPDYRHFRRNDFDIMPRKLPQKHKTDNKPISKLE
jgi:hypothetical protein